MPFAFIDGFDDYPASMSTLGVGLNSTWIDASNHGSFVTGRFGGLAVRKDINRTMRRSVPSTTQITMGLAVKQNELDACSVLGQTFIQFNSTTDAFQFAIGCDDLGNIKVGTNLSVPLAVAPKKVLNNTWHYIEFELVLSDTVGRIKLWIDGEEQFDVTNVDTKANAATDIGRVYLIANGSIAGNNGDMSFDDVYVKYDEASAIGECRAVLQVVTADSLAEWTRLSGATNAGMVDEITVDSDATYNSSNTVGQKDLFEFTDLVGNPTTIHAVQVSLAARKDDAGTRTIQHVIKHGATEWNGTDQFQTTDYTWQRLIRETNPVGDIPWTKADINALLIGYTLTL